MILFAKKKVVRQLPLLRVCLSSEPSTKASRSIIVSISRLLLTFQLRTTIVITALFYDFFFPSKETDGIRGKGGCRFLRSRDMIHRASPTNLPIPTSRFFHLRPPESSGMCASRSTALTACSNVQGMTLGSSIRSTDSLVPTRLFSDSD
jgi:hypothetical protein